jgi:DNA polymerase-3 subunit delta
MAKPTPTFYLLHGEDNLSRDEEIDKLRARFAAGLDPATVEMNTAVFDGKTAALDEIKSACEAFPFLAERRLVIVKGLVAAMKRDAIKALAEYLPALPDWARLVLVEDKALPDNHRLVKLARDHASGFERAFHAPRNASGWIRQRAAEHGAEITPAAAAALAEVVGADLLAADNELVKLALYVDGARSIEVDDVAKLTVYVAEANIFEMVDAVVQGDGKGAISRLHRLLEQQDPLSIFGMIIRQFRLLLLTKTHLDAGGAPGDALAQAIDVHPYAARKLPAQARDFTMPQLEDFYRRLMDYDMQIKTGRIDAALALDLLVAALAG